MTRAAVITANIVLVVIVAFFVINSRMQNDASASVVTHSAAATMPLNPLDEVSSADIAVTVSRMAGLTEATAVTNQADSEDVAVTAAATTNNVVSKPQVTATPFKSNKDIQTYVVQSGDTVSSIASKFNVTSDSIRWSNNLSGETVTAGSKLLIPPVGYSGIVYTVKSGDTIDSLASKYHANKSELVAANDAEISGIHTGERIIIPNGTPPAPVRTYASAYAASAFAWGGYSAQYGGNGYDWGQCTWWAAKRRAEVGKPVPANLGNAITWKALSQAAGIPGGSVPRKYAVIWYPTGGYGHVGFVESVDADGTVHTSEMNVNWIPGQLTYRTIPASQAGNYYYIY